MADNPAEALARRVGAAVRLPFVLGIIDPPIHSFSLTYTPPQTHTQVTTDQEEQADAPFALSSSVVETSAGGAAEGLASIHRGLEREGLGGVGAFVLRVNVWMSASLYQ